MSHSETRHPFVPPFAPSSRSDDLDDDLLDPPEVTGEGVFQREGLPGSYRMRHDAHYVDQLATRSALAQVRAIPIRDIEAPAPAETAELGPLVESIVRHGVLQPLIVRSRGIHFELIAGSKRLAAAAAAGLSEVPCLVHACDDARARALAEADNVRAPVEPRERSEGDAASIPSGGLRELQQSIGTIDSCLSLLAEGTSLRDRVALDLIRTEAYRAERLVRALAVLLHEPTIAESPQSMRLTVEETLEALSPERRLAAVHVNTDFGEGRHAVHADPDLLQIAVTGIVGGLLALVQSARLPALWVTLSDSAPQGSVALEVSQQAVTLPRASLARFFDAEWTDRPGGYQAAVALAAARRAVGPLRGSIEALPGDRGGCRVRLVLPAAR